MTTTPAIPNYVTLEELATVIHVKPATIRGWANKKLLPAGAVLKLGRTHRYDLDMILAAMRSQNDIPLFNDQDGDNTHD